MEKMSSKRSKKYRENTKIKEANFMLQFTYLVSNIFRKKNLKVSRNFSFTMEYRYGIVSKTTLCTAVFNTVQTEQAGSFLGPGRKMTVDRS